MLQIEKELFENLISSMKDADHRLKYSLNGEKKHEIKNELILFTDDVEEFVGLDGSKMGPYKKGDIANIAKEIAKILIDSGKAEVLEGEK